ncbi:MAG TPA: roadblock/LC7 domain-containing protein [Candidatus Deferrimicrobium sp.]|nr:roadblock/LC7 domain-containing protein [Candidatus Deferrimicrobium sp.]
MQQNRAKKLDELLVNFGMVTNVHATAIVSRDGFIIASIMENSFRGNGGDIFNDEIIAGMAAEMNMLGERTTEELLNVPPERIIIDSEAGTIVLVAAGKEAVIISVIDRASLGITLLHLKKLARETESLLLIKN